MKPFFLTLLAALLLTIFALLPNHANASHAMGGDIYYTCLGGDTFQITMVYYNDCAGIAAPNPSVTVQANSPCGNVTVTLTRQPCPPAPPGGQPCEVSPLCPASISQSTCNGGSLPGVQMYVFQGTAILPACNFWTISYSLCCRNAAITNLGSPGSQDLYLQSTLNNLAAPCNNAPIFTSTPVPYICAGVPFYYNGSAIDIDGDSLVYTLIQPRTSATGPINYSNGTFNPYYPLQTTTGDICFNSISGQMIFTPMTNQNQIVVLTFRVEEYRNGVLIGSIERDIQVVVLSGAQCSNNPPFIDNQLYNLQGAVVSPQTTFDTCSGTSFTNWVVEICPNVPMSFEIRGGDPDLGNNVTLFNNVATNFPAATFTTTYIQSDSVHAVFSWTPSIADTGVNVFAVSIRDDGCPVYAQQSYSYTIYVLPATDAGPDRYFCNSGGPVQLSAAGGSSFVWTPAAGLSNDTIQNPLASPTQTTDYIVVSNLPPGCKNTDTVTVFWVPDFTYSVSPDDTICMFSSTPVSVSMDPNYAPYTVSWNPGGSLSNSSSTNPIASPLTTTTYAVTMTSDTGCQVTDSVTVYVIGVAPNVNPYVSEDTVCPGATVILDILTTPQSCGISPQPCNVGFQDYNVGTGNTFNNSTTSYPAVYGHFYEGAQHQILYLGSELIAAGFSGGTINSIALDIAQINGTTQYCDFTIRMGTTNATSITTFQPGLQTVFTPKNINIAMGWNTHVLDFPFDFDGSCNIIVEFCFNNDGCQSTWTQNSQNNYTVTPFNSVVYYRADNTPGLCGNTGSVTGTSNQRPNTRFNACMPLLAPGAIVNWSGPGIQSPGQISTPATVNGTTQYQVTVDDGNGCVSNAFITVIVDTTVFLNAGPDTNLCSPGPVQLWAQATGTPLPINLTCGANNRSCASPTTYTLGTGTSLTPTTSPFVGNFTDHRVQYLFTQQELAAQGITAGIISSIDFSVGVKQTFSGFENLSVKVGCTNMTSLNAFVPGLTTVFSTPSFVTVNGWNVINFNDTYDWDGTSNLIIEVCIDGNNWIGDDVIRYTATSFNSVAYASNDFTNGCNLANPTFSTFRPNVRFGICPPPPGQFTYSWTPSTYLDSDTVQNPIATPTQPITYTVEVTDGQCVATAQVTISFGGGFAVMDQVTDASCPGVFDGSATIIPQGGFPPYTYSWSTGDSTATVNNLAPGNYDVTVVDDSACITLYTVTVGQINPMDLQLTANDPSCFNTTDGSINTLVTGGTVPYSYIWSTGATTPNLTNLSAGTIVCTVTDANGCSIVDSVTLTTPPAIVVTFTTTDESCPGSNDGTATVNVIGGTPPYNYLWDNFQNTPTATGLSNGTHYVGITDANGCLYTDSVIIVPGSALVLTTGVQDVSINGGNDGMAWVNASGGTVPYSYNWSNGQVSDTAINLSSGSYFVVVTDALGCSDTAFVFVDQPTTFTVNVVVGNVTCFGADDGAALGNTANGGTPPFSWSWSNGDTTNPATNLPPGNHSVTVTDATGFQVVASFVVTEPPALTVTLTKTDASCSGAGDGSATATAGGGTPNYTYSWSNGTTTPTATGLNSGWISVTVTDLNGCEIVDSIEITEPVTLTFTTSHTDATCFGTSTGTASVFVNGGSGNFSYSWSNTQTTQTATNLAAGTYSVTATDDSGCFIIATVTIGQPAQFFITVTTTDASCFGFADGSASADVNGDIVNYTFVWGNGATGPVLSNVQAGAYTVQATDTAGCQTTATLVIGEPAPMVLSITNTPALCFGGFDGSATVSVTSGGTAPFTYLWSNTQPSATATNLSAGTYTVTVTDANGCSITGTTNVTEPAVLLVNIIPTDVSCFGYSDGAALATVSGGTSPFSYSWSNGQNSDLASGLIAGVYTVTVTDNNNCTVSGNVTLSEPPLFTITDVIVQDAQCVGYSNGGLTVLVSGGLAPYTYYINVGTSVTDFSNGQVNNPVFGGLTSNTTYAIAVEDANGCLVTETRTVGAPPIVIVNFPTDPVTITIGEGIQLDPVVLPGGSDYNYFWEPQTGLSDPFVMNPVATPYLTTTYELTVTDQHNCSYSDNITVEVENPLVVFVPNAFSPNGDNNNEILFVYGKAIKAINWKIFDRWGEKVFETNDKNIGWDGTYKGKKLPPQVFVYLLEVEFLDNFRKTYKGSVTIIQ